ncbi:entericidin EcnAB [Glycocaulis abyssi]|uniref:Entericidin EcnAB n=1 Tax=Glycocaulis abyssi TaxID=1433403 RepID=A0ABV9NC54_9PROT
MTRALASALLAGALLLALTACNTIQGVGRDITRVGEFLDDVTQ